ncbi:hypothetical protein CEXT_779271 [Caerostris extrusa]|uniref:Uncharacterized protein n=1 Tax=Caerostris extrusa TaxID=172846 RepID=A0AAV4X1L7_CAEEX|nr:hypothetical protein CEXT_779271 [Caerostris extrusa]
MSLDCTYRPGLFDESDNWTHCTERCLSSVGIPFLWEGKKRKGNARNRTKFNKEGANFDASAKKDCHQTSSCRKHSPQKFSSGVLFSFPFAPKRDLPGEQLARSEIESSSCPPFCNLLSIPNDLCKNRIGFPVPLIFDAGC